MKIRPYSPTKRESDTDFHSLARALAALDDPKKVAAFLRDLCTPAELESMCDRWKVVPQCSYADGWMHKHPDYADLRA